MDKLEEQIAQQLHDAQSKYVYFLLAAAASCIAWAVQRTTGLVLSWSQLPLGIAIVCWGASFWSGCRNRDYFNSVLHASIANIQLSEGSHPDQPSHPVMLRGAIEVVSSSARQSALAAGRWAAWQFRLIVAGALFFLCWHVLEMALNSLK